MIHSYYCLDCGNSFKGEEIVFDLAKLLDIKGFDPQISLITFDELLKIGGYTKSVQNGETITLEITLQDFLIYIGKKNVRVKGKGVRREKDIQADEQRIHHLFLNVEYSGLDEGIRMLVSSDGASAEQERVIKEYRNALETKFLPMYDKEDESLDEDDINDLQNYCAFLYIKPIMFDDEPDKVYTIEYSNDQDTNLIGLYDPQEIRGYCPTCGAPIIKNAGKYPHRLIGLIGAASAGKTSVIISMVSHMMNNFDSYNIEYPQGYLCDGKFYVVNWNMKLFDNGWAPVKTPVTKGNNNFNISMLLQPKGNTQESKIVTFVDIAGEQCFDVGMNKWKPKAFIDFPLIGKCDIYLTCSSMDASAYGDDKNKIDIPPHAVMQMTKQLIEYQKKEPAPLCLLLTKDDLTPDLAGDGDDKIFREAGLFEKETYSHRDEVLRLKDIYVSLNTNDKNIKSPIEWIIRTYKELRDLTYVSITTCSALGGPRRQYRNDQVKTDTEEEKAKEPENMFMKSIPMNTEGVGELLRMDVLWKWLLKVLGLNQCEVGDEINGVEMREFFLKKVPRYQDKYSEDGSGDTWAFGNEEAINRVLSAETLFINSHPSDYNIHQAYMEAKKSWFMSLEQARVKAVANVAPQ